MMLPDREHLLVQTHLSERCSRSGIFSLTINQIAEIFPLRNMKISNTKTLGSAIRDKRRSLKVTQKELAMASGTGLRFIVDIEKGKNTCQTGKVFQVLQALGLHVSLDAPQEISEQ